MAITVMEVLKNLPRTNCGDCGQATCLAFATHVIKEGEDLNKCPHLTGAGAAMGQAVKAQQEAGVGRRRESLAISLEVLQEKVAPLDFAALAEGLGATYGEEAGRPYLTLAYFGHPLQVFKDELRYPPGAHADPWDAILLYNYIASQSREPVAGRWIAYNSLPNSVSKAKTLTRLEQKLADHFAGQAAQLKARADRLGADGGGGRGRRSPGGLPAAAQSAPVAAVLGRRGRGRLRPPGPPAVRRQRHPLPRPGSHALPGGAPDGTVDGREKLLERRSGEFFVMTPGPPLKTFCTQPLRPAVMGLPAAAARLGACPGRFSLKRLQGVPVGQAAQAPGQEAGRHGQFRLAAGQGERRNSRVASPGIFISASSSRR